MINYIIKRLVQLVLVFIIALFVIFFIPRLMPGDPSRLIVSERMQLGTSPEVVDLRNQLIARFGLNKSYTEQFIAFVVNVFQGYFGVSWTFYPREVSSLIIERLPWTLFIMISARILSVILSYFVGVVAAWKHGGRLDVFLQFSGLITVALPIFWVGSVILMLFAYYIPIFPLGGHLTVRATYASFWDFAYDALYHAALPVLTMAILSFFMEALIMRNTMMAILGEDFILTAEAKGLKERTIMFKHAARNAMAPLVTGIFMGLGGLIVGSMFVETVFAYPGMGLLMARAIGARDYPLVQGIFVIMTVVVLISNLLADLVYMWLDPRVRLFR